MKEFEDYVNMAYEADPKALVEGYAPFCKHLILDNWTETTGKILKITKENEHLLKTKYEARVPTELPVLRRYFPEGIVKPQKVKYLNIILYSKK